ncbi:hypothetical protein M9978_19790 [Sphingomonas sp. MG17]|uniref:Uncharacterized protein n=2 Tax=Sphingomonas tagetis TaxID=2949092 RepID=A0A9X2HU39_9SPHN|nr:hypothetical protein [Sphingomonas tagetis]
MKVLKFLSPLRAVRDLRGFLKLRHRYELGFMLAAFFVTVLIVAALFKDSYFEKQYKREIIFVQNWRADRTLNEIIAQQKIDEAKRLKREAEFKKKADERQRQWKKIDDGLKEWGI